MAVIVRVKAPGVLGFLLFGFGLIAGYYVGVGQMSKEAFKEGRQEANAWREAQQRCIVENQRLHTFLDPLFGKFQVDPQ